jgi:uncharacterized protein (DUF305 family)
MSLIAEDVRSGGRLALAALLVAAAGSLAVAQEAGGAPASENKVGVAQGVNEAALAAEAPFLGENESAMTKMMIGMTISPSGDVNRDFVAMMSPHHQGAIDMAEAYLRHGSNQQLRRLAQEIIVTQQQEIAAMQLAIGEPLPPSVASPTQESPKPLAAAPGEMKMSPGEMMK